MQEPHLQTDNPTALLAMLNVSEKSPHVWPVQELAAILRHELGAPLALALGPYAAEATTILEQNSGKEPQPRTLEGLLIQSQPSPEFLNVIKKFAKRSCLEGAEDGLPREIALVLYFLSIALARMRCQVRLSELPDEALMNGLRWTMEQDWTAKSIRMLAAEALRQLARPKTDAEQKAEGVQQQGRNE